MRIIPVVDLAGGLAVQARGGDRATYEPVESTLTPGRRGDAVALAQAYRDRVGARECYVADLDAIQGGGLQRRLLADLAHAAAPCALLVDAGIASAGRAGEVLGLGAAAVIVGLETLATLESLAEIVATVGLSRAIFSLDLRHGRPLLSPRAAVGLRSLGADELVGRAVDAGMRSVLVLDLARVGSGGGLDLELLRRLRREFPSVRLLAGGGVGGPGDLDRLADAGCDAALVATALHAGRIGQSSASASRQVADCP